VIVVTPRGTDMRHLPSVDLRAADRTRASRPSACIGVNDEGRREHAKQVCEEVSLLANPAIPDEMLENSAQRPVAAIGMVDKGLQMASHSGTDVTMSSG
jgi:hypothetical protein